MTFLFNRKKSMKQQQIIFKDSKYFKVDLTACHCFPKVNTKPWFVGQFGSHGPRCFLNIRIFQNVRRRNNRNRLITAGPYL